MAKRIGLHLLVFLCFVWSRPGAATSPEALPPGAASAESPDAGTRVKERRASDRGPMDPVEPDNFEYIIPPGREAKVAALFAGLADGLPSGVELGNIAIERMLARLAVVVDGRAAALVAAHSQREAALPNEVFRLAGHNEGLFVIGVCDGCLPPQVDTLKTLASVVSSNKAVHPDDIWRTKAPAPKATKPGAPSQPEVAKPPPSNTSSFPWGRLLRGGGALTLIVAIFLLLRSREDDTDAAASPSDDGPGGSPPA